MTKKYSLRPETIEKLKHYVYLLRDPKKNVVFYVGKGKGGRCLQHLKEAEDNPSQNNKIKEINNLLKKYKKVKIDILRHGLSEEDALKIESSVIDTLGLENLKNENRGHGAGIMDLEELELKYEAEELKKEDIKEKIMICIVKPSWYNRKKKLYAEKPELTKKFLDDYKGFAWRVDLERANKCKYVFDVSSRLIREIYEVKEWKKMNKEIYEGEMKEYVDHGFLGERGDWKNVRKRKYFEGKVAPKEIRKKYLHKRVPSHILAEKQQNPIKYVNL